MMKRLSKNLPLVFVLLSTLISSVVYADIGKEALTSKMAKLQLPFIENQGQVKDESVMFYANTFAGTVFVTDKGELVYSLIKTEPAREGREKKPGVQKEEITVSGVTLWESLDCPEEMKIRGKGRSLTKVSYFKGKKEDWRTNIPVWQEVSFGEVYKRIELKLRAYGKNVEKLFTVYPGGSVEDIKLNMMGAKGLEINRDGELVVETDIGRVKFTKPLAYQEINGKRVKVAANYTLPDMKLRTPDSKLSYGFRVEEYDRGTPLTIDPLLASTFLGGSGTDYAASIAINSSGDVYVAGYTYSSDFPVTHEAYNASHNGSYDIFVSKLDGNLQNLLASTFLGGALQERNPVMVLDGNGNVYVAGLTYSSDFPVTPLAFDNTLDGEDDIFISKLDSGLTNLLASTFLGGGLDEDTRDEAWDLAIDNAGNVYVVGTAGSGDFPVTPGAFDTSAHYKGFISKFDSDLQNLLASTFLGGRFASNSYRDVVKSLAFGSNGDIYVTGTTVVGGFPVTPGAYDTTFNCVAETCGAGDFTDAFVARLDNNLQNLLAATYLGSIGAEMARQIIVDFNENILVSGITYELFGFIPDFPVTPGAFDTSYNGGWDVYVSKFDSDLQNLLASTYLGTEGSDSSSGIMMDIQGNIIVTGYTSSPSFPVTSHAFDTSYNGSGDVFIAKFDISLQNILSYTYFGGSEYDGPASSSMDSRGNLYITGNTRSSDFPVTPDAYDTALNGLEDVFISKLDSDLSADCSGELFTEVDKLSNTGSVAQNVQNNIAVNGETVLRGLPYSNYNGAYSGIAYLYTKDPATGDWYEEQELYAPDGEAYDLFGESVSIGGETALIGAGFSRNAPPPSDGKGAAYIFKRDPSTGIWSEAQKLLASDGAEDDHFGKAVSMSGNTLIIGAPYDDDYGSSSGSAYLFIRDPSTGIWSEYQKLTASDSAYGDMFGNSVSISGDTVVVSATADNDICWNCGSVYVFVRDPSTGIWNEQAKLLQSDGEYGEDFGRFVSLSGDTVLIGNRLDSTYSEDKEYHGSAYVFERDPSTGIWSEAQKLLSPYKGSWHFFGVSGVIKGNAAVIGEPLPDAVTGYAILFTRNPSTGVWSYSQTLTPSDGLDDNFGSTVAMNGDIAVLGPYVYERCMLPFADPGGTYTGTEGQAITLDGSGSTDLDGNIVLYEWDVDNNGAYEYNSSSPTQSHTYAQDGTYTIKLRVTDNLGGTDESTTTADISDTSPIADFTGLPTSGVALLTVSFTDNSTGYDQPLTYEWDFDNDGTVDSTVQDASYIYNNPGTYTVKLTVTDFDNSTDAIIRTGYITVTDTGYDLTVNKTGTGSGTVTSSPAGINCGTDCTEPYDEGTTVTLTANPDTGSTFTGWTGGGCSGTGGCILSINADTAVAAAFELSSDVPLRIGSTYYSSLQNAYNAASDGDTIQSQAVSLTENLNINRAVSITIEGGYGSDFNTVTGITILNGSVMISNGVVSLKDIIFQ